MHGNRVEHLCDEQVNQMEPLDEGHIAATLIVPEVQTDCSAAGKDAEKPPADTAEQVRFSQRVALLEDRRLPLC
jgi:hypothetical protein